MGAGWGNSLLPSNDAETEPIAPRQIQIDVEKKSQRWYDPNQICKIEDIITDIKYDSSYSHGCLLVVALAHQYQQRFSRCFEKFNGFQSNLASHWFE